jgi:hypothetical protein
MRKTSLFCCSLVVLLPMFAHAQEATPPQAVPPPLVAPPPAQPYGYPPPAYLQPPPPPATHTELRPNYALIFSGVGVFGLGYILDVSGTLLVGHQPAWECAIPVVGPYLQVNDTFSHDWSDLAKGFYVFDGLLQTAGFVLTVVGASLWHKVQVRNGPDYHASSEQSARFAIRSTPNGLAVTF